MFITMRSSIVAGSLIALTASTLARACPPDYVPPRPAPDVVVKTPATDVARAAQAAQDRRNAAAVASDKYRNSQGSQPANSDSTTASQPATDDAKPVVQTSPPAPWLTQLAPDPGSPEQKAYTQRMKTKAQVEKELKKIRAVYFRASKNTEVRQVGISKIREYTDPAVFPSLISLFQAEGPDAEAAVLDHLADLKTDEADATLSWAAVFGKEKPFREAATKRLVARTKQAGEVTNRVKWPISLALRDTKNDTIVAGARLSQTLGLYDAIPMLINAQVGTGGTPGSKADDGGDAALAYILVGTQVAYVSGLTPVVGDNAVAFNPQLSVLTEGTVLRVIDAVVVTYRVEVNQALIGLSTQGYGQSTAALGWDQKAWREWYVRDFLPYRAKKDAELASAVTVQPAGPVPSGH